MNILFLSHTYIGSNYVVGSHHLSDALAKQGHKVVHIPHPWSKLHQFTRGSRHDFIEGQVSENRWQFDVGQWLPSKWNMVALDFDGHSRRLAASIMKQCKQIAVDRFDLCFIDDPVFQKTVHYLPVEKLIYRPTDIYVEMPKGAEYKQAEKQLLSQSDIIVATSKPILDYHHLENSQNAFVLGNGFDFDHFYRYSEQAKKPKTNSQIKICYVGSLDRRFDFDLVNQAARACHTCLFDIYSPDSADNLDKSSENLRYQGPLDYSQLPQTLQQYDLLIMPFTFEQSNKGRSPMKFFEYAASNVAMLVPSYFDTHDLEGVSQFSTPEQFITAIKTTSKNQNYTRDMGKLKPHSWPVKARQLLDLAEGRVQ